MFRPRVLRPLPREGRREPGAGPWATSSFRVLAGPAGFSVAEHLAALLDGEGRWDDCVWLRPDRLATPSAIAADLAHACRHRWHRGDHARVGSLAEEAARAPRDAVVVVELRCRAPWVVGRVVRDLRRATARRPVRVLVVDEGVRWSRPPDDDRLHPAGPDIGLPRGHLERVRRLAGPRHAVVHDVAEAARGASRTGVLAAVASSSRPTTLLDGVVHALLDDTPTETRLALSACLATGYWHPELVPDPVPIEALRPWVVALEDGWGWLRPVWAAPLARGLARCDGSDVPGRRAEPPRTEREPAALAVVAAAAPDRVAHAPAGPAAVLDVRLLGDFEVRVDGVPVARWHGCRGPAVFRYLLARPRRTCARDVLIEEFWPDVAPALARNRLQVAVSGVRRSLRDLAAADVVEFADGDYRVRAAVRVDTDVDRFRAALDRARRALLGGETERALRAYREAVELYRGDFAADAPFEAWTVIPRESLRLAFVDALDGLCRLQLDLDRLDEAITTGQRMLEADPCREDAHRLLMHCYHRQGRRHQVVRQYELCVRVLRAHLEVGPDARTTALYRAALGRGEAGTQGLDRARRA